VNLGVTYSRDRFDNLFVTDAGTSSGSSTGHSRRFHLGATYAITRVWSASCGVGYEARSSGVRVGGQDYGYDSRTGYCSATLALR
jgi:hypothetical protein